MVTKDESKGQRRVEVSSEFVQDIVADEAGLPSDARMLVFEGPDPERGTYTAVFESEYWGEMLEAEYVPEHEEGSNLTYGDVGVDVSVESGGNVSPTLSKISMEQLRKEWW